ncbi:MAG: geranylgeranylglycerol-phosphate geranylgeranyltransferase [Candidatus Tenebribacter davisii]|nr:geranylgeranylglycerol-phosphate geranylgeranyltransferase [Candidatus Tenebribacter davisii]
MPFIKIIRPFNCLFVIISVYFGAYYHSANSNIYPIVFAALSAALIAAAGYVINDFFDIPIDIINRPNRILPSGKISPKAAYLFSMLLFILGITASFFTQNLYCVFIAIFNSILLFGYAKVFKMSFIIGNILVAYTTASTFLYGGLCNNNLKNSMIIVIFAFLYTFTREIIKDGEDIEGDLKLGAKTLAVKIGRKNIVLVSIFPSIAIILYSIFLCIDNFIGLKIFLAFTVGVSLPLIILIIYVLRKSDIKRFANTSSLMKINMLMLLIILWVG